MTPNDQAPSKGESRWQFIERTVAVLEQMLFPRGATVQHNQFLPELATGTLRQCDVVVRFGSPPRQTLAAIVEVQDRDSKVGIQDFEAWCRKREKLGAQRLICVSCEGFTQEVVADASKLGDVVTLMTLCEPNQRPPFLATTVFLSHMQVRHYRDAKVVFHEKMPCIPLTCDAKVFERSNSGEKVALFSLADEAMKSGSAKEVTRFQVDRDRFELRYRVEFGAAGLSLLLRQGDQTYSVWEVYYVDLIEEVHQALDSTPLAYEQKNINGALAWVLFGKGSYQGKDFYTQQPFSKLPNGRIQPGPSTISKLEGCSTISSFVEIIVPVNKNETRPP